MNMQTRCFGYPFGLDVVSSPHRVLSVEAASRDYVWSNARVRCVRLDSFLYGLGDVMESFFIGGCDVLGWEKRSIRCSGVSSCIAVISELQHGT
jgi:hypothetical protein